MPFREALCAVLIRDLRTLTRELDAYVDEALLWEQPAPLKNSAGMLALHLIGNTRHFIGAVLGESGYVRDREFEFSGTPVPRSELQAGIVSAIAEIQTTLARLSDEELDSVYPIEVGKTRLNVQQFLVHLAVHFGYHLGQIDYHRRIVTGNGAGLGAQAIPELLG